MIAQLRVAAMLALAAPLLLDALPAQAPPVAPAPTAPATPPTGTKTAPGDTAAPPTATKAPAPATDGSVLAKLMDDAGMGAILQSAGITPEEFILAIQAIRQEQAAKKAAESAPPTKAKTGMSTTGMVKKPE